MARPDGRDSIIPSDALSFARGRPATPVRTPSPQEKRDENAATIRTIFPPWLYPMPSGNDFFGLNVYTTANTRSGAQAKVATLPAGVGQSIFSVPVKIPPMMKGVLRVVNIYVDAPTTTLDVDFITRINGGPIQGWTFASFPRSANNLSIAFPGIARLPLGSLLDVQIINRSAAGPWVIGVQISGWYWNVLEAKKLFGDLY